MGLSLPMPALIAVSTARRDADGPLPLEGRVRLGVGPQGQKERTVRVFPALRANPHPNPPLKGEGVVRGRSSTFAGATR